MTYLGGYPGGIGCSCAAVGGGYTNVAIILLLFILLVIISWVFWV